MMKTVKNLAVVFFVFLTYNCSAQATKSHQNLIRAHNQTIHLLPDQWMRDPFITLAPDGYYYLTFTSQPKDLPQEKPAIKFYKSRDLTNWEDVGLIWDYRNSAYADELIKKAEISAKAPMIWAPEAHFINNKWVIVNTSNQSMANIMVSEGKHLKAPFKETFGSNFGNHHDPTLFQDDDHSVYLISKNGEIQKMNEDLSAFEGKPSRIDPSNRKMGHEGMYMVKIQNKYVLFGTAWSTDTLRNGSYNLYYAVSDKATGPFGPRQFAGRFLGHGTPFKDKNGNWWCTAFLNGSYVQPEDLKGSSNNRDKAITINKQGLTLVPIDIEVRAGQVKVEALDSNYANAGLEEVQKF